MMNKKKGLLLTIGMLLLNAGALKSQAQGSGYVQANQVRSTAGTQATETVNNSRLSQIRREIAEARNRKQDLERRLHTKSTSHNSSILSSLETAICSLDQKITRDHWNYLKIQEDMRAGRYCSECKLSKTQIEGGGISFEAHLQKVKGHAVKMSWDEINVQLKIYRDGIYADEARLRKMRMDRLTILASPKQDSIDLMRQIDQLQRTLGSLEQEERNACNRTSTLPKPVGTPIYQQTQQRGASQVAVPSVSRSVGVSQEYKESSRDQGGRARPSMDYNNHGSADHKVAARKGPSYNFTNTRVNEGGTVSRTTSSVGKDVRKVASPTELAKPDSSTTHRTAYAGKPSDYTESKVSSTVNINSMFRSRASASRNMPSIRIVTRPGYARRSRY